MKNIKLILLFSTMTCMSMLHAQDPHFSQYSATQPYINPALTGFFDGDYRVVGIGRLQSQFANSPYKTYGASVDASLFKNKLENSYLGVGGYFYQDNAGSHNLVSNHAMLNLSYSLGFGYKTMHYLSVGLAGGMINKSIDQNFLMPTADQETDLLSGATKKTTMDIGMGVNYQMYLNKRLNFFVGYGLFHIHQPADVLINNSQNKIFMKHSIHGAAKIKVRELVNVVPTALIQIQGSHRETNIGLNGQFLLDNYEERRTSYTLGLYSRFGNQSMDAVIFMGKVEWRGLAVGLSYDLNVNEFADARGGSSAMEVSISFLGKMNFKENNRQKCPDLKSF
jgi:type IX secretion system PorP/SprF family membrane protein